MGWICNKCGLKHYDKREADECCSKPAKMKKYTKEEKRMRKALGITNKTTVEEVINKIVRAGIAMIVEDYANKIIAKELKKKKYRKDGGGVK